MKASGVGNFLGEERMQHYSCKCGHSTGFGSVAPAPCRGCPICKTEVTLLGVTPRAPRPHEFQTEAVETDEGVRGITRCVWCRLPRHVLDERG